MSTKIILGLCYGDEGKGLVTSCFALSKKDLVIRFSGGSQAGHTVIKDNYRHIFSSIGSGTLNGAHTYLSEYFALCPFSYLNEYEALRKNGYYPQVFIHPLAPIITPFDKHENRKHEWINQHGSVGIGYGKTIERHETTPYKLFAIDLMYADVLKHKLRQIAQYYNSDKHSTKTIIDSMLVMTNDIKHRITIVHNFNELKKNYENFIFEGSQGIMLDMDHGFFPHVTRSNTTSKNAMKLIKEYNLDIPDVYHVMRSYATRHGNGPFTYEDSTIQFEDKTNKTHKYQGNFRQGYHDVKMLKYALSVDQSYSIIGKTNLVITHMNETDNKILSKISEDKIDNLKDWQLHHYLELFIDKIYTSSDETPILNLCTI